MKKHISTIRVNDLNLIRLFKEEKQVNQTKAEIKIDYTWIKNCDITEIDKDFLKILTVA
jgi:hypothetical protein